MKNLKSNKIRLAADSIGEKLRRARTEKKIEIEDASRALGISGKYLEAIERGGIEFLPSGLYRKNYLREYARFLQFDADEIVDLFDQEYGRKCDAGKTGIFARKVPHVWQFLTVPKIIRNIIVAAIIAICVVYLGHSLKQIVSPPMLVVASPADNFTTDEQNIDIRGITEPEVEVVINGEPVLTDRGGFFFQRISLKSGLNTIFITAQKKYGRKASIVKTIMVKTEFNI